MPDPTSEAFERGRQGQSLGPYATQNERQDHAAGQQAQIDRNNQAYNQWGSSGGSNTGGQWSGGGGIDGPLAALIWLVFIFPFKLIWWTITGKLFRWVFGTWLGRIVTITVLGLAGYIFVVQTSQNAFETRLAEWWTSNPAPNATLYIDLYTNLEFDRTYSCRIAVTPARGGHLTHLGEDCTGFGIRSADSLQRYVVIEPNVYQEDRRHLFRWEVYLIDSDNPEAPIDLSRRIAWEHTLAWTGNGYSQDESNLLRYFDEDVLFRIEFDNPEAEGGPAGASGGQLQQ